MKESNRKDTISYAIAAYPLIYGFHLVEHIQLYRTVSDLCQYWTMESHRIMRN